MMLTRNADRSTLSVAHVPAVQLPTPVVHRVSRDKQGYSVILSSTRLAPSGSGVWFNLPCYLVRLTGGAYLDRQTDSLVSVEWV